MVLLCWLIKKKRYYPIFMSTILSSEAIKDILNLWTRDVSKTMYKSTVLDLQVIMILSERTTKLSNIRVIISSILWAIESITILQTQGRIQNTVQIYSWKKLNLN
jgi:hypothetical protein